MAISLKHKKTSAKADGGDASLIRPSDWNDEHDLTMAASRLFGRSSGTPGAAQEISLGSGLQFNAGALEVNFPDFGDGIHAATLKSILADADEFPLADSAASFDLKKATSVDILKYIGVNAQLDFFLDCIPSWVSNTSVAFTAGFGFFGGKKHTLPAYTKTMSAWVAGNNAGMLDTGVIGASKTYFLHAVRNTTSGVCDYLASLSLLAPTVPSGWELNPGARIGLIITNASSQIIKFVQRGNRVSIDRVVWFNTNTDIAAALAVVAGIPIGVPLDVSIFLSTSASGAVVDAFGSVSDADVLASPLPGPDGNGITSRSRTGSGDNLDQSQASGFARCNAAGQLVRYVDHSSTGGTTSAQTQGWIDYTCKRLWA